MTRVFLLIAALAVTACGEKDPNNQVPPDLGPDEEMGVPDLGPDLPISPPNECQPFEDFGDQPPELIERQLTTVNQGVKSVTCEVDEDVFEGTWIGRLRLSQDARTVITVDGLPRLDDEFEFPAPPVWELREGECAAQNALSCGDERSQTFELAADTDYFIVVNGQTGFGGIQVQVSTTDRLCEPGERTCADGVVSICNILGTGFTTAACIDSCAGPERCAADRCDNPHVVNLTPGIPERFTGRRAAYVSEWTSRDLDACDPFGEPGPAGPSDGPEFFVRFPGLVAGQRLVLDAEESEGNMAFYVLPECSPAMCLDAFIFDDDSLNRADYEVPTSGDVLVAIEAVGRDLERNFTIEASLIP